MDTEVAGKQDVINVFHNYRNDVAYIQQTRRKTVTVCVQMYHHYAIRESSEAINENAVSLIQVFPRKYSH